ncbi:MAG: alginate lyase [Pseudomonadales bacterium]|nr:alginate lyase [Halioglobus sp.]MCP5128872.1 alginate lyase [Pseudomonadales bacterium]
MTSRHFVGSIFALLLAFNVLPISVMAAEQILVKNQNEFQKAVSGLKPGDTVVLANGVWNNFEINFSGKGTAEQPITLTAETKGKVIISGQSNLHIAGEYLVVSGLVFKNGYSTTDSVISFRKSEIELANHSRVTETVVDNFNNPERVEVDYYVAMYGKHNRFDHNHLAGKRNKGVTMAVILDSQASQENHHRIDHNYFGPRPVLGSNGGETLRIGTSAYSLTNSFTLVENNYFDRCDGEVEIVSVKSGRNHVRGNLFFESQGGLALRHGNDNLVEANVFLGNGVAHTGGIRVINKGQIIRNNYLESLTGTRFGAGLVVMNGVPDSPINKYHQVDGALIENNSLVNIDHIQLAEGSDASRTAAPINSEFRNNLIFNESGRDIFTLKDDVSGIKFSNNVLNEVQNPQITEGFASRDVVMTRGANGLLYPESRELSGVGASRDLVVLEKSQTGAPWYPKPDPSIRFGIGNTVDVTPEPGALENAIKQAQTGDVIRLAPGDYVVSKILHIDKPLTLSGDGEARIEYERTTLFEIADGGSLQLRGLSISGKSTPDNVGNSVIRSSRYSMLVNYQISIENCEITDLTVNRAFNFFYASKQTMADSIDISGSRFSNISGAILKLDNENDDEGIYNADYVRIKDSSFTDVQGALVDLYRGGTDESTFGPHFSLTGSQVRNVGTGSRNKSGASVYLHGVQVATIENNLFSGSAPIKVYHTVGDPVTRIVKNTFAATPVPEVTELNSQQENTALIADNTVEETPK